MNNINLRLEIADFIGFCDLNGEDALDSSQVEKLEDYIYKCNNAIATGGDPIVVDAIYDRLCEILKKVNPDAKILGELWSDSDKPVSEEELEKDVYSLLKKYPMMSICTCKSYDCQELQDFVDRLPEGVSFDAHVSCKENGHGVRIVYCYGYIEDATSRMRASGGHNITSQMTAILEKQGLENIDDLADYPMIEIRGEVVLPLSKLGEARQYNPNIVSAFSGVASMLRDSASEDETKLLDFVAYKVVSDDIHFNTKSEEYEFLESLGFTTPLYWLIPDVSKETLLDDLPQIVADCEEEVKQDENDEGGYEYYTDGLVFEIDDRELFNSLGTDGHKYNYGNIALKVGFWQQDLYYGYVQTILWTDGKMKYSPVAIIADEPDMIEFASDEDEVIEYKNYVKDIKEIANWKELGVTTAAGNKVRRVPLYEPNNMIILDAYPSNIVYFRYGGEAGVVPCFMDGTPLSDAKIKHMFEDNGDDEDYDYSSF